MTRQEEAEEVIASCPRWDADGSLQEGELMLGISSALEARERALAKKIHNAIANEKCQGVSIEGEAYNEGISDAKSALRGICREEGITIEWET